MALGSLEIIALSMLLNMALEIRCSKEEFKKGYFLEGFSHLLMSLVRFSQAVPYMEKIAYEHDLAGKENFREMTATMNKIRDKAAFFFYSSARSLVHPFWKVTDSWLETIDIYGDLEGSKAQKVSAVAKSAFSTVLLLPFALGGLFLGQACHFSAFLLSTAPYIHLKGNAETKEIDKELTVLQNNGCFTAGGFARMFGGTVLPNKERAERLAEKIKESNPDLVCLQEVSDMDDALTLYRKLSDDFAEFYLNIGATPFILQNNSGLFVASKVAIENPELYSFSGIAGTEGMVNKCAFLFSTKIGNFINTHLSPSKDDLNPKGAEIKTRGQELEMILEKAEKRHAKNDKPCFVLGDFNINWNSSEYQNSSFFKKGNDHYNKDRKTVSDQDATAETQYLIERNWKHQKEAQPERLILDYFVSFFHLKEAISIETSKIDAFNVDRTREAFSDHNILVTKISLMNQEPLS